VEAPLPQAASAWVFDRRGRILLIHENYDRRRWGPPGGAVEPGESPLEAVRREFEEETGAAFEPTALIGLYHVTYPSGRLPTWVGFCFAGEITGTPAVPTSGEIADLGWFAPDELPSPRTNLLQHALGDACARARGVARVIELD
jgi:8-oxo-dGTP pyrophosphatase MutT (NUDIX family)